MGNLGSSDEKVWDRGRAAGGEGGTWRATQWVAPTDERCDEGVGVGGNQGILRLKDAPTARKSLTAREARMVLKPEVF